MKLDYDRKCFACGPENPLGLQLNFWFETGPEGGEEYVTRFTPQPHHQGYVGVTHGGILSTVLDEVMARLAWEKQLNAITAKMEIRLRKPVPVGETVTARGRIVRDRGRSIHTEAELYLSNGEVAAEATAMLVKVD